MTRVKPSAVLAGSSHLMCFGVPLHTEDGRITLMPLREADQDFLCLNGPFPRNEAYWNELQRLAADYKLFIVWRGNQHMAQHLFASDPLFDFVLSDQIDLPIAKGSMLVPEQMLREDFLPTFDRLESLLKGVGSGVPGVFICGTPPPKGDIAVMRAAITKEPYFVERLAALGTSPDRIALTPPVILYKMWVLIQNMLKDVAHQYGAHFVPVPVESQMPDGFLRKEFWSSDATHTNSEFGRLFLGQLRRHIL